MKRRDFVVTIRSAVACSLVTNARRMAVSDLELSGKSTRSCDCHNHCFVRPTRVTYAVFIVKARKVGAEMQGLAQRISGITLKH